MKRDKILIWCYPVLLTYLCLIVLISQLDRHLVALVVAPMLKRTVWFNTRMYLLILAIVRSESRMCERILPVSCPRAIHQNTMTIAKTLKDRSSWITDSLVRTAETMSGCSCFTPLVVTDQTLHGRHVSVVALLQTEDSIISVVALWFWYEWHKT